MAPRRRKGGEPAKKDPVTDRPGATDRPGDTHCEFQPPTGPATRIVTFRPRFRMICNFVLKNGNELLPKLGRCHNSLGGEKDFSDPARLREMGVSFHLVKSNFDRQ